MNRAAILAAILLAAPTMGHAAVLLNADFQNGKTDGWAAGGAGDVRLSTYAGNVSLQLTGKAAAGTRVPTQGLRDVVVSAKLAALGLGDGERCIVEAAGADGVWTPVVVLSRGQDDGVTLRPGVASPSAADDGAVRVRVRADGGDKATCWADDVRVVGQPIDPARPGGFSRAQLLAGDFGPGPTNLAAFAPPPAAGPATQRFVGHIMLDGPKAKTRFETFAGKAVAGATALSLPPLDALLVQDGADLIPVVRGPIPADNPDWEWVLAPGAVWDQPGDDGFSRAALPFALEERNANCLHQGVMTFLFKSDGTVSDATFEIAGETCAYQKFDAWGVIPASASAAPQIDAKAVIAAYRTEVAARLPARPLAELEAKAPGFSAAGLRLAAPADGDVPTSYGLLVDGVHYASACPTRHGDHPFCAALPLPSYSTAKSIFGGVGLMRLEALRPGVRLEAIAAHVPECAAWREVTLADTLNMATGIYGSTGYEVDENAPAMATFFAADGHAAKASFACSRFGRRAAPDKTFVYHTTDTYLLGAAMADVLRKTGGGDVYEDLVARPIWSRLNLSPLILQTRRTYDPVRQPFTGWGLTYQADDILRIAAWLRDGATIDGVPALDGAMLKAALQRDPADRGIEAFGPRFRYKYGFWARDLAPLLGCKAPLWAPFMSGYGGISVVLMPNGVIYYVFGDSETFDWAPAALQADKIKRMCP